MKPPPEPSRIYTHINPEPYPSGLLLDLTDACNLRCRMCHYWGEDGLFTRHRAQLGHRPRTLELELARRLIEQHKKHVMVVSADVYRPAAIDQLQTLANEVKATFIPSDPRQKPVNIAKTALDEARRQNADVLLVDTAGRLAIDEAMMAEIKSLQEALNPIETLFVVDAMTGQDAANTAKAFNDTLSLTGIILTKLDGTAKGGVVVAIADALALPVLFVGVGEKADDLRPFEPQHFVDAVLAAP